MLRIINALNQLSFRELMRVYEEGNRENGAELAPDATEDYQFFLAEQDFYSYLRDTFFRQNGAFYAVWEENGSYISALRVEPYRDGLLMEALETKPDMRRMGYATALIQAVQSHLTEQGEGRIYSHVSKKNTASLITHRNCGFSTLLDYAVYIDGSINRRAFTMVFNVK